MSNHDNTARARKIRSLQIESEKVQNSKIHKRRVVDGFEQNSLPRKDSRHSTKNLVHFESEMDEQDLLNITPIVRRALNNVG